MKAFSFSLQAVHTVRANQERRALEAFAQAQADVESIASKKRALETQLGDLFALRQETLCRPACADEFQRMQNGQRALQLQLSQCGMEMEKAQVVLAEKSRALLDARQKREVVDKLREKQLASYNAQATRVEQKVADDIAIMKGISHSALRWR